MYNPWPGGQFPISGSQVQARRHALPDGTLLLPETVYDGTACCAYTASMTSMQRTPSRV